MRKKEPTTRKEREFAREAQRKKKQETISKIVELANAGMCISDIASEIDYSYAFVQRKLQELGITPQRKKRKYPTKLDHVAMRTYFAEGHTAKETAEKFGTSTDYTREICKGIRTGNQYTNGLFDREANAIRYIRERTPNFEYVGNFTGIDGYVDLKCKTCGTVITKSFVSVKHGKARCDICWRNELNALKEQKATERKEAVKEQRRRQKYKRLFEAEIVQLEFPSCNCCGQLYVPRKQGVKYCSAECMNRANNAMHKDRRVRRLKEIVIDSGITLERLYERDKGVCYICGCVCDWNDYEVREDNTFIAHDNYPSIDHIKPISKGGLHSWDNVKLACRKCNYQKRDAYLPGA